MIDFTVEPSVPMVRAARQALGPHAGMPPAAAVRKALLAAQNVDPVYEAAKQLIVEAYRCFEHFGLFDLDVNEEDA